MFTVIIIVLKRISICPESIVTYVKEEFLRILFIFEIQSPAFKSVYLLGYTYWLFTVNI